MSTIIGNYRFSEIDLENITVVDEGVLKEISNLYSNDYGKWLDSGKNISLSPEKFLNLHRHEVVYFITTSDEKIIGFSSVSTRKHRIKIITSMCIKKEYRNLGIGTSLISYILDGIHEDGNWRIGVVTANPVMLLTLETHPRLNYIDLEEETHKDKNFGIQLSIFIDEFRRKSYSSILNYYKRSERLSYRKIDTSFTIEIPEIEIQDGLGKFYRNLMGILEKGEEWILFCNYKYEYEPSINNTI